jgi:ribosomal protein S18 acetylase RimI-like enzyme
MDHSEHALVLLSEPSDGPSDPHIILRQATQADVAVVARLLEAGFGEPVSDPAGALGDGGDLTLVIELEGESGGTVRVGTDGDQTGIYGFVVHPAHQGRGIGRDVLRRLCTDLRAGGSERVGLEVAIDNTRALELYTSIGFTNVITEDYYRLLVR